MGFRGHHCPLQCLTDLDSDVQRQEVSHCTTPLWKEECGGIYVPTQFRRSKKGYLRLYHMESASSFLAHYDVLTLAFPK